MIKEVRATGVKFKRAGKIYDYLSGGLCEKVGDIIVIEAEKGEDLATVAVPERVINVDEAQEMKKIVRIATEKDMETAKANRQEEDGAFKICAELIEKHELQMKLLLAEYSLDRGKLTFYYTAENRVDFRQLVKNLAKIYRTRIEMRQIGVRDATKMLGGFGICGRELCCATFLRKFDNISIKSAKDQNVSINPSKISGICGRLICCLVYDKTNDQINSENAQTGINIEDIGEIVIGDKAEGDL
ncbi:MAG: hypothetical protein LBH05_03755 [Deferribacteraceae bacterium]|jgi:cell fate regulator YaaT (PSP1 superfamily)|nr:hypothetical protein [Deferribacteraceae bacterium]